MRKKQSFIYMVTAYAVFILFTVLITTVDVKVFKATDSKIGFYSLNTKVLNLISGSEKWDKITDLGIIFLMACCLIPPFVGFIQLIKRKSLKKVDFCLVAFTISVGILVLFFILFEVVHVNYRPILENGKKKGSYPSSHTLGATFAFLALNSLLLKYVKNKYAYYTLSALLAVISVITIVGRLLCQMHFITDIIGAILLSCAVYFTYDYICSFKKDD